MRESEAGRHKGRERKRKRESIKIRKREREMNMHVYAYLERRRVEEKWRAINRLERPMNQFLI